MIGLLVLLAGGLGGAFGREPDPPPVQAGWTANLAEKYGFQRFDREINKNWVAHQGLAFLSLDRIAIYQLNQKPERVTLSPRDESGGAGNFYLQIEILDTHDGHEVARLRLPACGMFSNVMPALDGNFIVRTGEVLRLYSSSLKPVASYRLPLEKGESEIWETTMSASGDVVVAVRRQMYPDAASTRKPTYVEVLDAATLRRKSAFTAQYPAGWLTAVGDRQILTLAPGGGWSLMDFEGHEDPLDPSVSRLTHLRYRRIGLLAHDYLAVYGEDQLAIMSSPTEQIFNLDRPHQFFLSLAAAGRFLAVEVSNRPPAYKRGRTTLPDSVQIAAYDLKSQDQLLSVDVSSKGLYFAISAQGDVGIIHKDHLQLLHVPGTK